MTGAGVGAIIGTAAAVASGEVTSEQAVTEALRRIDELDGPIGSVVARRDAQALREARELDGRLAREGAVVGPLHGVPVLVKDLEDVAGMPTRRGSRLFAEAPPATVDEVVPARLRAAGAVIVGKTNLPEFATEGFTDNLLDGPTRNPWNLAMSPGGSSGGSAAALSAGLVPIATATDGGGSVRIPAAACGLVGLKPTAGLIGRWPAPDWLDLSTYGPMATRVADLALLLDVMAGPVAGDPSSAPRPAPGPTVITRLVAVERTAPWGPLEPAVHEALHREVEALGALLGLTPEWVDGPALFLGIGDPDVDWFTLCTAEHVAALGRARVEANLDRMHPAAAAFLEWGLRVEVDEYLAARRRRTEYARVLDRLLGDDVPAGGSTVLAMPTLAVPGLLADGRPDDDSAPGAMLPPSAFSTALQNTTGHPAISLPAGRYDNGVPHGLQITAARWRDDLLLDLARRWEQAYPWPLTAPGYEPFVVT